MEKKCIKNIKTGYVDLDEIINIEGNKLIVLASRPCIGKSTFGLNILKNIAIEQEMPVLCFNLEWSRESINKKLNVNDKKIYIEDKAGITISEICEKARKMKREHDISFILIDYLQLVKYDEEKILRKK